MQPGFQTQLNINQQQRLLLAQQAGVARYAWNQGFRRQHQPNNLALCQPVTINHKLNRDRKIKIPPVRDLHQWLVASIKSPHPCYYDRITPSSAIAKFRLASSLPSTPC